MKWILYVGVAWLVADLVFAGVMYWVGARK
jgi:hypothetical protein